ncbi:MAG: HlyC/CorC family transporter [Oligosphaeraceae bacterium]|nr:HlyC/CorC family transporter [Oligosphaeraceae bacterium]
MEIFANYLPISTAILVLLAFSAFFSGSETAIMSLSRAQVKRMANGTLGERAAYRLLKLPQRLLAIVLVGNMLVNVLLTALCATLLSRIMLGSPGQPGLYDALLLPALQVAGVQMTEPGWNKLQEVLGIVLNIALLTPILIIFGELSPKSIAYRNNLQFTRFSAIPLLYFGKLLAPLLWLLQSISAVFQRLLGLHGPQDAWGMLTQDEIAASLAASEAGGATSGHERELLERIMRFGHITASDIMVPRTEIVGVEDSLSLRQAFEQIRVSQHSFLPVYHEDFDDVWGVIAFTDFPYWLNRPEQDRPLADFRTELGRKGERRLPVYKVSFVPPSVKIDRLLADMRKQSIHFTIVVGEYGGTLGIVTISAILEEVIGRFATSGGNYNELRRLSTDDGWLADGRARLRIVGEKLKTQFPGESDSIGGLLMEVMGRVPAIGDRITAGGYDLCVTSMVGNRVGAVAIRPLLLRAAEEEVLANA